MAKFSASLLASTALVLANFAYAQSAAGNASSASPTTLPAASDTSSGASGGSGSSASAPGAGDRIIISPPFTAKSDDPFVQRREARAQARKEYREAKKAAKQEYRAEKREANAELREATRPQSSGSSPGR